MCVCVGVCWGGGGVLVSVCACVCVFVQQLKISVMGAVNCHFIAVGSYS